MLSLSHIYKTLLFIAIFLSGYTSIYAQGYVVNYKDSLTPLNGSSVVYNNLEITNTGSESLTLNGTAVFPKGWQPLFNKDMVLQLAPKSTVVIPINIMSSRSAAAVWSPVVFKFWTNDSLNAKKYTCLVKATPRPSYIVQTLNGDGMFYDNNPHNIKFSAYLKNTGNLPDTYTLHFYNTFLKLDRKYTINLNPGRDTVVNIQVPMNNSLWKAFSKESVMLMASSTVKDETSSRTPMANSLTLLYELSRSRSTYKENRSAFTDIPVTVQGGMFAHGKELSYFGGLLTNFQIGDHSVMFNYRSKQLSNIATNFVQRDFFSLDYRYKHFFLRAATIGMSQNFFIMGKSLGVGYSDSRKTFSLTGTMSDKNSILQQGNNLNALAKYEVAKNVSVSHNAEMNLDNTTNLNSYIVDNKIELVSNNDVQVSAHVAASSEQKTLDVPSGVEKNLIGYAAGYAFRMKKKQYNVVSQVDHYSPEFAGLRKGMSNQIHSFDWNFTKSSSIGLLYNQNLMKRNFFRDSLYNSDLFTFNTSRYGLAYRTVIKKNTLGVISGFMEQKGDYIVADLNKYYFGEITSTHVFNQDLRMSAYIFLGGNKAGWITNNNISIEHKWGGITALYTRNLMQGEGGTRISETVYGGPFVNFSLLRRKLTGTVRYNVAKSVNENTVRSSLNAVLVYVNEGTGTRVNLNGTIPFKTISNDTRLPFTEQRYGAINISQDLHIPLRRKFYDIKVVMFNDENNNNIKDPGEEYLQDVPLDINNMTLFTDANGSAQYRNIQSGNYTVGVYKAYSEEGIIPTNGPSQMVSVDKHSSTLQMPFKKGRVISGTVRIIQDALNTTAVSHQFIKIVASDSLDRKYTTLTDEEGNFFLYVPEGIFTVSLNTAAFTGNTKPVRSSFDVDILSNESAFVAFELRQKKREVRFLNQSIAKPDESGKPEPEIPVKPVAKAAAPQQPVPTTQKEKIELPVISLIKTAPGTPEAQAPVLTVAKLQQPVAQTESTYQHAAKRHQ